MAFRRCQNGTGVICSSHEEISNRLDGGYFGMFLIDTNIEPLSLNSPIKKFGKNLFTTFSIRAYRDLWVYLKTIQINSDIGWLMEDEETINTFSLDRQIETWDFRDTSDVFFNFILRCSQNREVFDRSYIKTTDIAAQIGGIVKFLFLCGQILTLSISKLQYKQFLIKTFCETDEEEIKSKKIDFRLDDKIKVISNSGLESRIVFDVGNKRNLNKTKIQKPSITSKEVNLNNWELLLSPIKFLRGKSLHSKLLSIDQVFNNIQGKLDIIYLMKVVIINSDN
jgi:hypothetical protein